MRVRCRSDLDRLGGQVGTLDDLQAKQIQLNETWRELSASATTAHKRFRSAISQVSDDAFYNITMDLGSAATTDGGVGEGPDISAIETALSRVVEMQLPIYQTTYELSAAADSLLKLLTDARSAAAADVTRLAGAFDAVQSAFTTRDRKSEGRGKH